MTKKTRARQKLKWQRQILLGTIAIGECRMESSLNILGIMGALRPRNRVGGWRIVQMRHQIWGMSLAVST